LYPTILSNENKKKCPVKEFKNQDRIIISGWDFMPSVKEDKQ
jgi:hypothetical protein